MDPRAVLGMHAPLQSKFFQLHAVFGEKIMAKTIGWQTLFGVGAPIWKILDPSLTVVYILFVYETVSYIFNIYALGLHVSVPGVKT